MQKTAGQFDFFFFFQQRCTLLPLLTKEPGGKAAGGSVWHIVLCKWPGCSVTRNVIQQTYCLWQRFLGLGRVSPSGRERGRDALGFCSAVGRQSQKLSIFDFCNKIHKAGAPGWFSR